MAKKGGSGANALTAVLWMKQGVRMNGIGTDCWDESGNQNVSEKSSLKIGK